MSNRANFNTFTFQNPNSQFISGMAMNKTSGSALELEVTGSFERIPTKWKPISAAITHSETQIVIQFERPINFYHFRIDVLGLIPNDLTANCHFITTPIKTIEEVAVSLKQKTITFVGCARNCVNAIRNSVGVMQSLGQHFGAYTIAVFENDSTDGTKELLAELQSQGVLTVIQHDGLDASLPLRTERIAYGRNQLLGYVRKQNSDYFCVADLDGILGDASSVDGFLTNFTLEDCWDAVFPINRGIYYDIWTFRHPEICPDDYERRMNQIVPAFSDQNILDLCLHNLQNLDFSKLTAWLKVDSAFGGIGLYKTASFAYSSYFGYKDGYEVTDHLAFHEKARLQGATFYINPGFVAGKHKDIS